MERTQEHDVNLRVCGVGILRNVIACASGGQGDIALPGGGTTVSLQVEREILGQQQNGIERELIKTLAELWEWTRETVHHVLDLRRSDQAATLAPDGDGQARKSAFAAAILADLTLEHRRQSAGLRSPGSGNGKGVATGVLVGQGEA